MFTSFSTALSALAASSAAINVVGNNLANLNTPGFKTSDVIFRDLVTQSLGAELAATQVGFGTAQPLTVRQFTQGALQTTGGLLDGAIQGNGFFILKDSSGNTLYTRAGNFQADKQGNLLTATGERVQGWTNLNSSGQVDTNGPITDIIVPVGSLKPPKTTTGFTLDLNLDSAEPAGTDSAFSTPITVYDSLGTAHVLAVSFEKADANQWNYQVSIPGEEISGGTAGTPFPISGASGTITFDTDGKLADPPFGTPIEFDIPGLVDGASDMHLSWDAYNSNGVGRLTQYGQKSAASASSQDGSAAAQLIRIGLGDGGELLAGYSNGDQVIVGQIALASVRNPDTLIATGDNNYQLSMRSALPAIGTPGTGGRGNIVGGSIEASTVDIAREFTNLITFQRGYEANARVVTTTDTLSQDTINLIR